MNHILKIHRIERALVGSGLVDESSSESSGARDEIAKSVACQARSPYGVGVRFSVLGRHDLREKAGRKVTTEPTLRGGGSAFIADRALWCGYDTKSKNLTYSCFKARAAVAVRRDCVMCRGMVGAIKQQT